LGTLPSLGSGAVEFGQRLPNRDLRKTGWRSQEHFDDVEDGRRDLGCAHLEHFLLAEGEPEAASGFGLGAPVLSS
jgi:hypothetical protein